MKYKHFWQYFFQAADGVGGGVDSSSNPSDSNAAGGGPDAGSDSPLAPSADAGADKKLSIFDKPVDIEPAKQEPADKPAVPEEYQFNLGEGLSISDELKARFTKVAKESNMTQQQADALMKMHSEAMLEVMQAGDKQAAEWESESVKQGLCTKEKLGYAVEAIKVFGGDEVRDILIQTGVANHPAVLGFLERIGELIHEDSNKEGQTKPADTKDLGAILFANSKY